MWSGISLYWAKSAGTTKTMVWFVRTSCVVNTDVMWCNGNAAFGDKKRRALIKFNSLPRHRFNNNKKTALNKVQEAWSRNLHSFRPLNMDARIFLFSAVIATAGYISVNGKPIPQGISADPNVQPAKESELMVSKCFLFPLNDALLYSRSCTGWVQQFLQWVEEDRYFQCSFNSSRSGEYLAFCLMSVAKV